MEHRDDMEIEREERQPQQERPMRRSEQQQSNSEGIGQTMRVIEMLEHKLSDAYRIPMKRNKGVVDTLLWLGKSGNAAQLAQGVEKFPASGESLMNIALVTYIENQTVALGVVNTVDGGGELDYAEVGGEVSARFGYAFGNLLAQLIAEFYEIRL